MKNMTIIQRNVFCTLRIKYFGSDEQPEPMSAFKQARMNRLLNAIESLPEGSVTMANPIFNHRLRQIINDERHAIDTSMETIALFSLLVGNVNAILNRGIPLIGVIKVGQYLRTRGDKVDFVKLGQWTHKLHLMPMIQLQGSILILFFGFSPEEIPFVNKVDKSSYRLTLKSLSNNSLDTDKEWHFRQLSSGFVTNNTTILRRNLRRSIRYIPYAPSETVSNFFASFARSLQEIEE